jgi:hypothetical protein
LPFSCVQVFLNTRADCDLVVCNQLSEGEEEVFAQKPGAAALGASALSSRGGRKRSILALNDPQSSVYDSMAPSANLVSVSLSHATRMVS